MNVIGSNGIKKIFSLIKNKIDQSGNWEEIINYSNNGDCNLPKNLSEYKLLIIHLYVKASDAVDGGNIIPYNRFIKYTTMSHAFGVGKYDGTNRVYGFISYVNDTKIQVQVSNGYGICLYGIRK